MAEPAQTTNLDGNPWVEYDQSAQDAQRSFWNIVSWPFGLIPSTPERRLVFYLGATAQVRPPGRHLIPLSEALVRPKSSRRRPVFRIGWVAMTPAVREVPVGPIWSQDGIEFTATFSFVLSPLDTQEAIARLACGGSEEEKRIVNTLQKAGQSVLVGMDADVALGCLPEVFMRIQALIEESLAKIDLPFRVLEPRVESCRPVDPQVATASLERQRMRAAALLEAERSKQQVERAERDARSRAFQLENERKEKEEELKRKNMEHAFELAKLIKEAETAIARDKLKAEAAPAILERTATAEAGRDRIRSEATSSAEKLIEERRVEIARMKAELAKTPEGLQVLYPQETFALEMEKARYSTAVMTELRRLEASGAFFGGQYEALKQIMQKHYNLNLRDFSPSATDAAVPAPGASTAQVGAPESRKTGTDPNEQTNSGAEGESLATATPPSVAR
jgi:hypothetical protein